METELVIEAEGVTLPATLTLPSDRVRGGVVVLHGAEAGERDFFLYEHLAALLAPEGVAVLRYDRRPAEDGHDVPFHVQAADALVASRHLSELLEGLPLGLWGYSQGAWAVTLAAATEPSAVDFLVTVSGCGVSPAEQMRVGCARQLRKHGYGESDVADLLAVRRALERFLRTGEDPTTTQSLLDRAARAPWSAHAHVPRTLPAPGAWHDMDFDPAPTLARVTCPVLAFYGESDEWVPIEESVAAWCTAQAAGQVADLSVTRLPGTHHLPTEGGRSEATAVSPVYGQTLVRWLDARLA